MTTDPIDVRFQASTDRFTAALVRAAAAITRLSEAFLAANPHALHVPNGREYTRRQRARKRRPR